MVHSRHLIAFIRSSDPVVGPREFRGVANFSTFLLDSSTGVLFMGARDAILAVDTNRLDQPPRKVGRVFSPKMQKKKIKMQEYNPDLRPNPADQPRLPSPCRFPGRCLRGRGSLV